jgi:hypothetical protein
MSPRKGSGMLPPSLSVAFVIPLGDDSDDEREGHATRTAVTS